MIKAIRIKAIRIKAGIAVWLALFLILTAGCTTSSSTAHTINNEIVVYAAASLTESMEAAKVIYESEHPEVNVVFNFAGSQVLTNQIKSGGQPDMFFSANEKYVDELMVAEIDAFDRISFAPTKDVFAKNKLVVLVDENLEIHSLTDVFNKLSGQSDGANQTAKDSVAIVVASEEVPVGRYTQRFLNSYLEETGDKTGYDAFIRSIVSYESNVKNVLAKSKLHEADLVVVYTTDAGSVDLVSENLVAVTIPKNMNQEACYGALLLTEEPEANDFYQFMTEGAGQQVLSTYGFEIGE